MRRVWIAVATAAIAVSLAGVLSANASARITPRAFTANTTPKLAVERCRPGGPPCGRLGYVFHTRGKLYLGDENYNIGCSGKVLISFSREIHGNRRQNIVHQIVELRPDCTYEAKEEIGDILHSGQRLLVEVRFLGNAVIAPIRAPNQTVRVVSPVIGLP